MKTTEFIQESAEKYEYDDEVGMVKNNLHTLVRMSIELAKSLDEHENVPEWAQEKIAVAKSMIVAVGDYMISQHEMGHQLQVPGFDPEQAFAEAMGEQDVAEGSLNEANSLKGTIDSIVVHGESVAQIYEQMKVAAKKFVDNHGELRGFSMVAAGVGSRWFQSFYFNKLQGELYALAKQAPKYGTELIEFLKSDNSKSFGKLARDLPEILEQIGSQIGSRELMRFGNHWAQRRDDYKSYLASLEDSDEDSVVPQKKKPKDTTQGQQNAQADALINQAIKDHIPAKYQGEVRNTINRLPIDNRIAALQKAIEKFKLQGVAEGSKRLPDIRQFDKTVLDKQFGGSMVKMAQALKDAGFSNERILQKISDFKQGVAEGLQNPAQEQINQILRSQAPNGNVLDDRYLDWIIGPESIQRLVQQTKLPLNQVRNYVTAFCQNPDPEGIEEGEITKTATGTKHRSTDAYGGTEKDTDHLRTLDKHSTNRIDKALGVKFNREKKFGGGLDLKESDGGGTVSSGIAVSMSQEGHMPNEIIKRQKTYTNQRTPGGPVKIKKAQ